MICAAIFGYSGSPNGVISSQIHSDSAGPAPIDNIFWPEPSDLFGSKIERPLKLWIPYISTTALRADMKWFQK
jgi:hypothetical protein